MTEDAETRAIALLYQRMIECRDAARAERIAAGTPRFTDLDADGRREYMRAKKRESRAAARGTSGLAADASGIRAALADAVLESLAADYDEERHFAESVAERALRAWPEAERPRARAALRRLVSRRRR